MAALFIFAKFPKNSPGAGRTQAGFGDLVIEVFSEATHTGFANNLTTVIAEQIVGTSNFASRRN